MTLSSVQLGTDVDDVYEARRLQSHYYTCEEMLKWATTYANNCWVPAEKSGNRIGCFRDSEGLIQGPHVVNTSTALYVISRKGSPFRPPSLDAFDGMDLTKI